MDTGKKLKRSALGTLFLGCILVLVATLVWQLSRPLELKFDQAQCLYFGERVRHGAIPYLDFSDSNPPLMFYLSALPGMLSDLCHLHVIVCFKLIVCALSVITFLQSAFILKPNLNPDQSSDWRYLTAILAAVALFGTLLGSDFGQREHIMILCFLPFFFLRWQRWEGRTFNPVFSIICGAEAAVGLCMKPQFLIIPLLTECGWLARKRRWKILFAPEMLSAAAAGITYAAHILWLPAGARDGFIQILLDTPFFNEVFGYPYVAAVLMLDRLWPWPLVFLISVLVLARFVRGRSPLLQPLVLLVIGGYLCSVVQHKFWEYYKIPMMTGICMLAALELSILSDSIFRSLFPKDSSGRSFDIGLHVIGIVCCILAASFIFINIGPAFGAFAIEQPQPNRPYSPALARELERRAQDDHTLAIFLARTKPGDKVLVVNASNSPAFPAITQLNLIQATKYTFAIPLLCSKYAAKTAQVHGDLAGYEKYKRREAAVMEAVVKDKERFQPKVLLVRVRSPRDFGIGLLFDDILDDFDYKQRIESGYRQFDCYQSWTYGKVSTYDAFEPVASSNVGDDSG